MFWGASPLIEPTQCDERQPGCLNCVNRSLECQYQSSIPLTWIGRTPEDTSKELLLPNTNHDGPRLPLNVPSEVVIPPVNMPLSPSPTTEKELLTFQLFTSTIYTAAHDESTLYGSQTYVSREAQSHEFLMHRILAFSALHVAHTKTGKEQTAYLTTAALGHHNQGLAVFRPMLENVRVCNHTAAIAFAALAMLFTLAYFQHPVVEPSFSPIDDIGKVFLLARGSDKVFQEFNIRPPLRKNSENYGNSPYTSKGRATALRHLHQINDSLNELVMDHDTDIYSTVIHELDLTFEEFSSYEQNYHIPISWAIKIPNRYFILLKERNPRVLVIPGHYCVMLHRLRHIWWLRDWGVRVLQAIRNSIDNS